jgi:hypothetical protein
MPERSIARERLNGRIRRPRRFFVVQEKFFAKTSQSVCDL